MYVMHWHVPFLIFWLAACTLAFHLLLVLSRVGTTPSIRAGLVEPMSPIRRNDHRPAEAEFKDQT
jgi:hypothetical protein